MGGISNPEISQQCDIIAIDHSIPVAWVRYHVDQKAGKPCPKCGGTGRWQGGFHTGTCFRCNGSGGKAAPMAVQMALEWVITNVAKVKKLGAKRDAKRKQKAADKWAAEEKNLADLLQAGEDRVREWAEKHPRHAWALENMDDGEFKTSLQDAARRDWMTENRMNALWEKADELELRARGDTKPAPEKGTAGDFKVRITGVDFENVNTFGELCVRIDFKADDGWRGRLETQNKKVEAFVRHRTTDEVLVTGKVRWNRGDYAIIGGRVKVALR